MRQFTEEVIDHFYVEATEGGIRLDSFVSSFIDYSRSYCSDVITLGHVLVNGRPQKSSYKVKVGDQIDVDILEEKEPDLTPKQIDFDVLHETENYAIINKPAGLTVHPAPGNFDNTLVNGLMYRFNIQDNDSGFRPGIVHRLDKDTSGLMLIAKHQKAREAYSALFKDRLIDKQYLAVCYGKPKWEEELIESYINRHRIHRMKMCSADSGKYAKSHVTVLWKENDIFLAKIKIFTGRTHQIRVHMSDLGFPLVGDALYGNKMSSKFNFPRQALHSHYLKFNDPFLKNEAEFKVGLPKDMSNFLSKMDCKSEYL